MRANKMDRAPVVLAVAVVPQLHVAVGQIHLLADLSLVAHQDEVARPAGHKGQRQVTALVVLEGVERNGGDYRNGERGELDGRRGHGGACGAQGLAGVTNTGERHEHDPSHPLLSRMDCLRGCQRGPKPV